MERSHPIFFKNGSFGKKSRAYRDPKFRISIWNRKVSDWPGMEDTVKLNFQALLFDNPWSIWILLRMKVVIPIANFEKLDLLNQRFADPVRWWFALLF